MASGLLRNPLACALDFGGLSLREVLLRTYRGIADHELGVRAAAIAYYALSALVPFLGVVVTLLLTFLPTLARFFLGDGTEARALEQFNKLPAGLMPAAASELVEAQIARLRESPPVGLISVGLLLSVWLASGVFKTVISSLDRIEDVEETRSFVKLTVTALVMTVIEASILVTALLTMVIWPQIMEWLGLDEVSAILATVAHYVAVILCVMLSFSLAFYVGPSRHRGWTWITPGSLVGTGVWLVATLGFRAYVQYSSNYDATYGTLGGVILLLFWIWLTAYILLSSAALNRVVREACQARADQAEGRSYLGWGSRRPSVSRPS